MEGNADQEACDALDLPCRCPMPVTSLVGTYDVPPITGIPDSIKGFLNVSRITLNQLGPILLTWINFNPSMDE